MTKLKQYDSLVIHHYEEDKFHLPVHAHTYFELVYIFEGSGSHQQNENRVNYLPGDLFVISPGDEHYFDIQIPTRFAFVKFTDNYFHDFHGKKTDISVTSTVKDLMYSRIFKEGKLEFSEPYQTVLKNTFESIVAYDALKNAESSSIVYQQILTIFAILSEVLGNTVLPSTPIRLDNENLLAYIHQFVYDPARVQVNTIADHFNIAPGYFSAFFKRNFNLRYRDYVGQLRLKLIEERLTSGTQPLKQISETFGFANEGHFSNYFKSKKGITPKEFRNLARIKQGS